MALPNPVAIARAIHGEKGGAEIEELPSYPIRLLWPPPSRALPEIQIPQNPRATEQLVKQKIPFTPSLRTSQVKKFTRQEAKNGSRRLKEVDDVIRDN